MERILKSDQSDRLTTFGVIMTTGTVMGLCVVPFLPMIEPGAWKYLVSSVLIHILYYTFLLKAYSYGDLSHTYPIARGLGPLLVALVSGRFIGEELRNQDIVGVCCSASGGGACHAAAQVVPRPGGRHGLATLFAVLTGVTIAAYIIADGMGVRTAGPTFQHRISYIAWLCVVGGPWLLVLAVVFAPRRCGHTSSDLVSRRDRRRHRQCRLWHRDLCPGVGPDGPCRGPARDSVLFGALIGTLLLGEPFGVRRVAAAAVIVVGLVLMNGPPAHLNGRSSTSIVPAGRAAADGRRSATSRKEDVDRPPHGDPPTMSSPRPECARR